MKKRYNIYCIMRGLYVMIKILRESIYNRIMLASFILVFVCNLISLLLLHNYVTNIVVTVFTILSIPLSLLLSFFPYLKKPIKKKIITLLKLIHILLDLLIVGK